MKCTIVLPHAISLEISLPTLVTACVLCVLAEPPYLHLTRGQSLFCSNVRQIWAVCSPRVLDRLCRILPKFAGGGDPIVRVRAGPQDRLTTPVQERLRGCAFTMLLAYYASLMYFVSMDPIATRWPAIGK